MGENYDSQVAIPVPVTTPTIRRMTVSGSRLDDVEANGSNCRLQSAVLSAHSDGEL